MRFGGQDNIDFEEPDDDIDVDVCLSCGRYYSVTPALETAWRNSFNYREGAVMDQKCLSCMRGDAPPHEY
jgi:hypothetical protein